MLCQPSRGLTLAESRNPAVSCPVTAVASQTGHTLVEMIIVVIIIGLAAALAMPSATPAQQQQLDFAAAAVADAFRFAREEARRTGVMHGVTTDIANDLVRVFRLDEGPDPNLKVFDDVRHPLSKQPYAIQLGQSPYGRVALVAVDGQMVGTCDDPGNIAFDSAGVVRCVEPTTTRIDNPSVDLSTGQLTLTVAVDSFTGRVSVQ